MIWFLILLVMCICFILFGYARRLPMPRHARFMFRRFCRFLSRFIARMRNMRHYANYCNNRRNWFCGVITCFVFASALICISQSSSHYVWNSPAASRDDLKYNELLNPRKQHFKHEAFYKIQAKVDNTSVPSHHYKQDNNTTFATEFEALLKRIKASQAADAARPSKRPDIIKFPCSLRLMPHLQNDEDSLRPAYELSQDRPFAEYIIGVPHVKRDKEIYLYGTIQMLTEELTEDERNTTMIVIMVGETDMKYVVEVAHNIERLFAQELSEGLIQVISPNKHYYPDLDHLPPSLGDSPKRIRWRTKQNLDAIYLMAYSESKCFYYLLLEDDVLASEGYMTHIRNFAESVTIKKPNWIFIQFSTTGGIGKLFRTTTLVDFITFVQLFYAKMPIDWITQAYVAILPCGANKRSRECALAKASVRPTYKTNLFSHVGRFSSLKGKIQKVKGDGKIPPYFPHKNPPVHKIVCTLRSNSKNTIRKAYEGTTYYWGKEPRIDDVIEFWFKQPTKLGRYLLRSGSLNKDRIFEAVVEVLPFISNDEFKTVGKFDEFGIAEGFLDGYKYGNISAFRVRFLKDVFHSIMITEIEFASVEDELAKNVKERLEAEEAIQRFEAKRDSQQKEATLKNKGNRLKSMINLFG